jgi:hypothetical protein
VDALQVKTNLGRRWRMVLVGLVATFAGVGYVFTNVPLSYTADGTMVLIAPPLSPAAAQLANNPAAANPLLSFSGSLNVMANITIQSLQDKSSADALRRQGATASYVFGTGNDGKTPLITVSAKSSSPTESIRTAQLVITAAQNELARRQELLRAPSNTFITATVVTHPSHATKSWGGRVKDLVIVIGFGVLATFLAAESTERRSQQRMRPTATAAQPPRPVRLESPASASQRGVRLMQR